MAPECYSSHLRVGQVHSVDLKIPSQCQESTELSGLCYSSPVAQLAGFTQAQPGLPRQHFQRSPARGVREFLEGGERAVPCSSAGKTQPKGQVDFKRCWCLGTAAPCPSGSAVQGL